jgi:hypothetical protein
MTKLLLFQKCPWLTFVVFSVRVHSVETSEMGSSVTFVSSIPEMNVSVRAPSDAKQSTWLEALRTVLAAESPRQ